jgi:hypothetical chaperone protein
MPDERALFFWPLVRSFMSKDVLAYAIDFGTTNSLVAAASRDRTYEPLPIDAGAVDPTVLRSILFFPDDSRSIACGSEAIRACMESGMRGRFVRSVKRFLPVASFTDTRIWNRRFALEELVAIILRNLRERANHALGADVRAAVIGRPARFSDDPVLDRLAGERLERAARLAGFERIALCEEPVAAALDCADQRVETELVAVADLGGGTSDFTVGRLGGGHFDALAVGGIAVAGDALDGALMREEIAPHFGARVTYRMPFGDNVLRFPKPLLEKLCSPAELSLLDRREVLDFLRTIKSFALCEMDRECMDRLLCLVEDRLGFQLFEAVDAVKRRLSGEAQARFAFDYPGIDIEQWVQRTDFEKAASSSVDRIAARFEATLGDARVSRNELDRVYFTGGTAKVPAVIAAIGAGIDPARLTHVSTFHSVIQGLAERARSLVQEGFAG